MHRRSGNARLSAFHATSRVAAVFSDPHSATLTPRGRPRAFQGSHSLQTIPEFHAGRRHVFQPPGLMPIPACSGGDSLGQWLDTARAAASAKKHCVLVLASSASGIVVAAPRCVSPDEPDGSDCGPVAEDKRGSARYAFAHREQELCHGFSPKHFSYRAVGAEVNVSSEGAAALSALVATEIANIAGVVAVEHFIFSGESFMISTVAKHLCSTWPTGSVELPPMYANSTSRDATKLEQSLNQFSYGVLTAA